MNNHNKKNTLVNNQASTSNGELTLQFTAHMYPLEQITNKINSSEREVSILREKLNISDNNLIQILYNLQPFILFANKILIFCLEFLLVLFFTKYSKI